MPISRVRTKIMNHLISPLKCSQIFQIYWMIMHMTILFFGGDFNCNLNNNCNQSVAIKDFLSMYNMLYIDIMLFNSCEVYTFSNQVRNCHSVIDYICVSSSLINNVSKYDIMDSPFNYSDHEALLAVLDIPIVAINNNKSTCNYGASNSLQCTRTLSTK